MGRGADGNPLYGVVLPRGSQQPLASLDSLQTWPICESCKGSGEQIQRGGAGTMEPCEFCNGSGRDKRPRCPQGHLVKPAVISVAEGMWYCGECEGGKNYYGHKEVFEQWTGTGDQARHS